MSPVILIDVNWFFFWLRWAMRYLTCCWWRRRWCTSVGIANNGMHCTKISPIDWWSAKCLIETPSKRPTPRESKPGPHPITPVCLVSCHCLALFHCHRHLCQNRSGFLLPPAFKSGLMRSLPSFRPLRAPSSVLPELRTWSASTPRRPTNRKIRTH